MKKLLVVCGPTATGKTQLGIKLAKKFGGEIVSADSRQVYQGLDIGTGKDIGLAKFSTAGFQKPKGKAKFLLGYYRVNGVKIWLLDVVAPTFRFTVADYVACARKVMKNIWQKDKLPVVVGGTGFYLKTLIDGVASLGIAPDLKLRQELAKKKNSELIKELSLLAPWRFASMNSSDRQNSRRLIRAIEVAHWQLKHPGDLLSGGKKINADCLWVGLKAPLPKLDAQIDRRVKLRLKQGLLKEIQNLLKKGYHWQNSALGDTLAYQEWEPFFAKKASQREVVERWQLAEHQYARAQLTWFKKEKRIKWFEIEKKGFDKAVLKLVKEWYRPVHG